MNSKIFILIPSFSNASPIKGAYALARGISEKYDVTVVGLKNMNNQIPNIQNVNFISLENYRGYFNKYRNYKKHLKNARKGQNYPISISFCFPADLVNVFQKRNAILVTSMRGMLNTAYRLRWGIIGYFFATSHIFLFRFYDQVIVMSQAMGQLLNWHGIKKVHHIDNFLDEVTVVPFMNTTYTTSSTIQFLYLGNLKKGKQTNILIPIVRRLINNGLECLLTIAGKGPYLKNITTQINDLQLTKNINISGYIPEPYNLIQKMDYLTLPSKSEGISRSVMEALFLGIPCIMRNIDGASEIIENGKNGYLFDNEEELIDILGNKISEFKAGIMIERKCLLPNQFRYRTNVNKFIKLFEKL